MIKVVGFPALFNSVRGTEEKRRRLLLKIAVIKLWLQTLKWTVLERITAMRNQKVIF